MAADDCIIDPNLMNKGVWAEPIFTAPVQVSSRGPASVEDEEPLVVPSKLEHNPDQYLEVQKSIPRSEPSLSQAWIEHTVLSEDN
jgi:hypothetical protein